MLGRGTTVIPALLSVYLNLIFLASMITCNLAMADLLMPCISDSSLREIFLRSETLYSFASTSACLAGPLRPILRHSDSSSSKSLAMRSV